MESNRFISIFYLVLLLSFIVVAQTSEDEKVEKIDHYLTKDTIEEFSNIAPENKNKVFSSANDDQKKQLLNLLTKDIYIKKALSEGGYINEKAQLLTAKGQIDTNYPNNLEFENFGSGNLKFYGEGDEMIIGDGKAFFNLGDLPKKFRKVKYNKDGANKTSFQLESPDGDKLILMEGSINEKGEISFISSRDGLIGSERFSKNLNDFQITGQVKFEENGIVLKNKDSSVEIDGFLIKTAKREEDGETGIFFEDDGVLLKGTQISKEGEFEVVPFDDSRYPDGVMKGFKVVFGDDWSSFLGGFSPKDVYFNDEKDNQFKAIVDKNGNLVGFKSARTDKSVSIAEIISEDSNKNSFFSAMSPRFRTMVKQKLSENGAMNIGEFSRMLFSDVDFMDTNPEYYKQFYDITDLESSVKGVAISTPDSSGKRNIFANLGERGAALAVYSDISTLSFFSKDSKEGLLLKLNPTSDTFSGLRFNADQIKKVGSGPFEHNIEEIYRLQEDGSFNPSRVTTIDKKGNLKPSKTISVFTAKSNPIVDQLVLNNRPISVCQYTADVDSYVSAVDDVIGFFKKTSKDADTVMVMYEKLLKLYDTNLPTEQRKDLEKTIKEQIVALRKNPSISYQLKLLLPENDIILPSSKALRKEKENIQLFSSDGLSNLRKDLTEVRNNPIVVDARMRIDREDVMRFDTSNIERLNTEFYSSNFEVDIGVRIPESQLLTQLRDNPLFGNMAEEGMNSFKELKSNLLVNSLTERIVESEVGRTRTLVPESSVSVYGYPDMHNNEIKFRLPQEQVDDISQAIVKSLDHFSTFGESRLIIRNNPGTPSASAYLVDNKGTEKELELKPATKRLLKSSISISSIIPNKDLMGADDYPLWVRPRNLPISPNKVYANFCNSVGYLPTPCSSQTQKRFNDFIKTYRERFDE